MTLSPSTEARSPMSETETGVKTMNEAQIKYMVDRFLNWRLPEPWNPDNGVSYKRPNYAHAPAAHDWPSGTNLFDATQADAMVRHMIEGVPSTVSMPGRDEITRVIKGQFNQHWNWPDPEIKLDALVGRCADAILALVPAPQKNP